LFQGRVTVPSRVKHFRRLFAAGVAAAAAFVAVGQDAPAAATSTAIPLVAGEAHAVATPSSPDAWGGARTGKEATLSDRVVDYRIEATLDAAKHAVDAHQQMTWRNRSDRAVSSIYVHLYLNAFENEGSTFFTERKVLTAGSGSRGVGKVKTGQWGYIDLKHVAQGGSALRWSYVHPDNGPETDHTVARIDLAQPVPAGGTLTLDMDFHSQLPRVIERTGYVGDFNLVAQWFPKIGVLELAGERGATAPRWNVHEFHFNSEFYADFGSFDVKLTAPKNYTVAAVGEQQGDPIDTGDNRTWHFTQGDVHDFAWMAAPGFKRIEGAYNGPGSPAVKVVVVYPDQYAASAQPALQATIDSLAYFSRTLGAYPYKTVTAVIPPYNAEEAGGMEYPTFFTAEGYDNVEAGTRNQYELDFVTIHEFGHGYFYGLLASNEFEEPMLDEGLNEYWDQRMLRERKQGIDLGSPFMKWLGTMPHLTGFEMERVSADLDTPRDPLGENSWNRYSSGSYGTVYSRTATAMHDLEERLGHDVTERAFKEYYARWHFRHPSAADLRQTLIDVSGDARTVNEIFDQYVFGTQWIDDRITRIDSSELLPQAGTRIENGKRIELTSDDNDKQVEEKRKAWEKANPKPAKGTGPYPFRTTVTVAREGAAQPQILQVTFADGSHERVRWDDARRWARFVFVKPVKAVSAELDPDGTAYLDANKLNDSRTVKENGSAAHRWTADVAAVLQGFYSMLVTL
jgi:hypothetical protein